MKRTKFIALTASMAALAFLAPLALRATQTEFWQIATFGGFLQGSLQGVSVSMNGELMLAPEMQAVFNPNETVALSVAAGHNGNIYIGTGHQGKVFAVNGQFQGKMLFQAQEPEILALAVGPDNNLYVGSSPEGKIYRVTPEGKSSVFYEPKVKYIWALAFDPQGRLYVGAGDRGEILRIDSDGKGGVFFASNQTHIMCLAFDRQGNLLAGSEPNGLVYRITPDGKAFVLYQSNLPEIHALATDAGGRIYAAALGNAGGVPRYFSTPSSRGTLSTPVQHVTVVATDTGFNQEAQMPANRRATPAPNTGASAGMEYPYPRVSSGQGALIQISPDGAAQTLWTSNREGIFGLAARGPDILFSTDDDGRIFDLKPSSTGPELTLLTETRESLPTRLLSDGSSLFVATSNIAKLIRIGGTPGASGVYESPVNDTHFSSKWGRISWRASVPSGSSLAFYTRSGNSARPDKTWTAWTGPYKEPHGSIIRDTPARYIQWKAVFSGADGASPSLGEVEVSYLNQNLPPEIESLTVIDGIERTRMTGTPLVSPGGPSMGAPAPAVTTTIVESGPYEGITAADPPGKSPIQFNWRANDPNHDQLVYNVYLKSEKEQEWHLVKRNLRASSYALAPDALADGEYRVRLTASDSPSNPPGQALTTELVSAPFWVDNTPPAISVLSQDIQGSGAVIRFTADSKGAPIRSAQVSSGQNAWHDIVSDDGIVDSQHEAFTVRLQKLASGEHVISLRVYDTSGNVAIGSAVLEIQ
ncbi:MAG TPA: hypothetical protein VGX94_05935 [Terriglobia bacterium]|nr:hypothetical protein [Terriglobia bacterium]